MHEGAFHLHPFCYNFHLFACHWFSLNHFTSSGTTAAAAAADEDSEKSLLLFLLSPGENLRNVMILNGEPGAPTTHRKGTPGKEE